MKFFLLVVASSYPPPSPLLPREEPSFSRFFKILRKSRSGKEARPAPLRPRDPRNGFLLAISGLHGPHFRSARSAEYQRTLIGLRLFHVRLVSAADPDLARQCASGAAHSIMVAAHVLPRYQLRN